jgi:hypothetical protein
VAIVNLILVLMAILLVSLNLAPSADSAAMIVFKVLRAYCVWPALIGIPGVLS